MILLDCGGGSSSVSTSTTITPSLPGTLTAFPASLNFGPVAIGSSVLHSVTITAGSASVTIFETNVTGSSFSVTAPALPMTLAEGQSANLSVRFAPSAGGSVTGSLSLVSSASNTPTSISLSGNGAVAEGTLTATPSSLSFGSVVVGSSGLQNATLTANATSITISSASTSGPGFGVSGLALPVTLAAGQSLIFALSFTPSNSGTATGSVLLANTGNGSPLTIPLGGTGVASNAHSVELSWSPSTSPTSGYFVYRSTTHGTGYARISATLDTASAFTDRNVVSGQTYFYVVTAMGTNNIESGYSNEVIAVIPTP